MIINTQYFIPTYKCNYLYIYILCNRHTRKGLSTDRYASGGENLIKTDLATSAGKDPCRRMVRRKEVEKRSLGWLLFFMCTCKWGENKMKKS